MEGSYSKVWRLCLPSSPSSLPRPEFAYFVSTLVGTIRNEIASCDERAYVSLPVVDVKTLLFFETDAEVREFSKQVSSSYSASCVKLSSELMMRFVVCLFVARMVNRLARDRSFPFFTSEQDQSGSFESICGSSQQGDEQRDGRFGYPGVCEGVGKRCLEERRGVSLRCN